MPKINLAQETMRNQAIARRRRIVYVFTVLVLVIVGGIYAVAFMLTSNMKAKVDEVRTRVNVLEAQLKSREPYGKEIKAFSSRLVSMQSLLKSHTRWSVALTELERLVLPSVKLGSLTGSTDSKEVTMDVQTPTIEAAADLIVSLENAGESNKTFFTNVLATSLGRSKESSDNTKTDTQAYSTKLKFTISPDGLVDKNISLEGESRVVEEGNNSSTDVIEADGSNQLTNTQ